MAKRLVRRQHFTPFLLMNKYTLRYINNQQAYRLMLSAATEYDKMGSLIFTRLTEQCMQFSNIKYSADAI
jgi:hypothetical protein